MNLESNQLSFGFADHSYQAAGGLEGITRLVNDFYDYMDSQAFAANIRAMHPEDLTTTRDKLTLFLVAWLGGPPLLKAKYGGINIPRVHQPYAIGEQDKIAWLRCMKLAIADQDYSAEFSDYLLKQLGVPANRIQSVCAYHFQRGADGD